MTDTLTSLVTKEVAELDRQIAELTARRTAAQTYLATVNGKPVTKRAAKSSPTSKNGPSAERVWLSSQGHKVGDRGRIPAELHALWVEYEKAEAEKLNAENPPAPPAPAPEDKGNDKSSPKATTTRPRTTSRASRASAKNSTTKAAA